MLQKTELERFVRGLVFGANYSLTKMDSRRQRNPDVAVESSIYDVRGDGLMLRQYSRYMWPLGIAMCAATIIPALIYVGVLYGATILFDQLHVGYTGGNLADFVLIVLFFGPLMFLAVCNLGATYECILNDEPFRFAKYFNAGKKYYLSSFLGIAASALFFLPAFLAILLSVTLGLEGSVSRAAGLLSISAVYPFCHAVLCMRSVRQAQWLTNLKRDIGPLLGYGFAFFIVGLIPLIGGYMQSFLIITFPVFLFSVHRYREKPIAPRANNINRRNLLVVAGIAVLLPSLWVATHYIIRTIGTFQGPPEQENWIYYSGSSNVASPIYRVRSDGYGQKRLSQDKVDAFAVADGWIYYSNSVDNSFYKMRTDGTDRTKLLDTMAYAITPLGEWVYFKDDVFGRLYKVRTDGSQLSPVIMEERFWYEISGDWIFYVSFSNNQILMRVDLNGDDKGYYPNTEGTERFIVHGDWIYFTTRFSDENQGIHRMRIDGSDRHTLTTDTSSQFRVKDNWLYYASDSLYKVRTDGSSRKRLNNDSVSHFEISGDWLVYGNSNDRIGEYGRDKLYRMTLDGARRQRVVSEEIYEFIVAGDWIYYSSGRLYKVRIDGTRRKNLTSNTALEFVKP